MPTTLNIYLDCKIQSDFRNVKKSNLDPTKVRLNLSNKCG